MPTEECLVQGGPAGASKGEDAVRFDYDGVGIIDIGGRAGFRRAQHLQMPVRSVKFPLPFPDLLQKLGAVGALERELGHKGIVR